MCAAPWPCPAAQHHLIEAYSRSLIDLGVLLAGLRDQAAADLHDADPCQVGARFTGWYRREQRMRAEGRDRRHDATIGTDWSTPMPSLISPLLQLDGVSHRHDTAEVHPVDLIVHAGARHAIVTPAPEAGSLLLQLIAGTRACHTGTIRFAGHVVTTTEAARRTRLGIAGVWPRPRLAGRLTVEQNVALAVYRHHVRPYSVVGPIDDDRTRRIITALNQTGLAVHAERAARDLSMFDTRLLALAAALARRPRLLLLDRPSAGLEPAQIQRLAGILRGLHVDTAVVFSDAKPAMIAALANTRTVLYPHRSGPGVGALGPAASVRIPAPRPPRRLTTTAAAVAPYGQRPLLNLHAVSATPLSELHLSIAAHSIHTIVGAAESGKTTLLQIIAGRRTPQPGAVITLAGLPVPPGSPQQATAVGISLASRDRLDGSNHNVGQHLAHAEQISCPEYAHRWTITELLAVLPRLTAIGNRRPGELSRIDQQALAIGVALLAHPRLLLLDDPVDRLTSHDHAVLAAALATISARGVTVLLTATSPDLTAGIASHVSVLHQGRIALTTPTAGLTSPATRAQVDDLLTSPPSP